MDTARLLRTSTTVLAVAGLLLSGCSAGAGHSAAASTPTGAVAASQTTAANRAAAPLAPLPATIPDALKPYYEQKLVWHDCGSGGFQCTTMKAPLDYHHPVAADDLTLSITRKRATGPGQRIGSLLVNPGGPGGSAIDYAQIAATHYPAPVRARYDIVGMDPRGVAHSDPVVCLTNRQMDAFTQVDNDPHNRSEINAISAADKRFADGCEQRAAKLLRHISTIEAARDMDILRSLLGDARLNYLGKSYGSMLGATYAGLFPSRVGRLVLDGAMDPSLSSLEESRTQAEGFETAFQSFAKDCAQHPDCPMGQTTDAAGRYIVSFLSSLDAHPLPTGQSRQLGESLGTSGLIEAMYAKQLWPVLRVALAAANRGDGGPLLALSDQYYERSSDGSYSNLMYANAAVNCLDLPPATRSVADVQAVLPAFRKASPHLGPDFAWMTLSCAPWPVKATGRPMRIEAKGAAPILVVGTTRDPATPYQWARSLASQLSSGHLLTYQGDGHTAYASGNDCIDTAVNLYLLEGRVPPPGKTCS